MSLPPEFPKSLAKKSTEGLYDIFEHADEYEPEALDAAQEEVRRRGLSVERAAIKRACALQRAADRPEPNDGTFRFNGIGTTLIGKRDFWNDSTFVTTVWFTFVFIPVFPIRSLRIQRVSWNRFIVFERLKVQWRQVALTYLFAPFWFVWLIGLGSFADFVLHAGHPNLSIVFWLVGIGFPPIIPFVLRYREKRAIRKGAKAGSGSMKGG